mmetsp:Transcript_11063/g.26710  ORF Transcript_11063/g.26710 Transcript_11063/m.26710 type:complete len:148 (+) Transcript_11063:232-675(+)
MLHAPNCLFVINTGLLVIWLLVIVYHSKGPFFRTIPSLRNFISLLMQLLQVDCIQTKSLDFGRNPCFSYCTRYQNKISLEQIVHFLGIPSWCYGMIVHSASRFLFFGELLVEGTSSCNISYIDKMIDKDLVIRNVLQVLPESSQRSR